MRKKQIHRQTAMTSVPPRLPSTWVTSGNGNISEMAEDTSCTLPTTLSKLEGHLSYFNLSGFSNFK